MVQTHPNRISCPVAQAAQGLAYGWFTCIILTPTSRNLSRLARFCHFIRSLSLETFFTTRHIMAFIWHFLNLLNHGMTCNLMRKGTMVCRKLIYSISTPGRRQTLILSTNVVRNRVFDCHLSPDWRQMAIEKTVSSDFFIHVRRLLRTFSIATYPVWFHCVSYHKGDQQILGQACASVQ